MPEEMLYEKLKSLHESLHQAESLDDKSRALLEQIEEDIRALMADRGEEPKGETLADRVREATQTFEEDHPQITETVGQVMETLARFGV
jgi:Domain of unknown function (DUF4404)